MCSAFTPYRRSSQAPPDFTQAATYAATRLPVTSASTLPPEPYTSPVSAGTGTGGWLGLPPAQHISGGDALSGRFLWLFPNVALSVLPNHVFMMVVTPEGPSHTVEATYLLSHPASLGTPGSDAALDKLLDFWDLVNQQDIEIVEKVQPSLDTASAYTGGRICYQFEEPVHRFQNMVIDRMVGVARVPAGDAPGSLPAFALPAAMSAQG